MQMRTEYNTGAIPPPRPCSTPRCCVRPPPTILQHPAMLGATTATILQHPAMLRA